MLTIGKFYRATNRGFFSNCSKQIDSSKCSVSACEGVHKNRSDVDIHWDILGYTFSLQELKKIKGFLQPSLLPLIDMNGENSAGNLTTVHQFQFLRSIHQPVKLNPGDDEAMSVKSWGIATSLRGLSLRTDTEVQVEMDILIKIRRWRLFSSGLAMRLSI